MPSARISVYLADDHPLFLDGIIRAIKLRPELELVGSSQDGRQALEDIKTLRPDVAVLDMNMPHLGGAGVTSAIRAAGLETRVVVLSAHVERNVVSDALESGAVGYLSKLTDEKTVCEAISTVARGGTVLPTEIELAPATEGPPESALPVSKRELEVLRLAAEGMNNPDIGAELFISAATVKTHFENIYEKLGVSSRTAAVAHALRAGALD